MVWTSRANLLSGRAGYVHHSPQASAARRTGHGWYSRHPSATSTFWFLHKTFFWRPFVIVTLYFVNALTHESFPFQGRATAPEIHVWSNSCPNWTEKKTWSASLPQQFGEGKAFYVFSNANYILITDEQSTSSPGSLPFTSLVAEERHP